MNKLIAVLLLSTVAVHSASADELKSATSELDNAVLANSLSIVLPDLTIESLPIHFARDPAKYLAAELLVNRLRLFARSPHDSQGIPVWEWPRREDRDPSDTLAIDLLVEQLKLTDMRLRFRAAHPAVEMQRQRVVSIDRQVDRRLRRGGRIDLRLLDEERSAIQEALRREVEVAQVRYTEDHPRRQFLEARNAAMRRLLR